MIIIRSVIRVASKPTDWHDNQFANNGLQVLLANNYSQNSNSVIVNPYTTLIILQRDIRHY